MDRQRAFREIRTGNNNIVIETAIKHRHHDVAYPEAIYHIQDAICIHTQRP